MNEIKDKSGIAGRIFNAQTKEPQNEIKQLQTGSVNDDVQ